MNRRLGKNRADIVIGMTLAEVFLLLLIIGWYGSRLESEEKGTEAAGASATVPRSDYDALRSERDELKKNLDSRTSEYQQLERILDWIAKTAGLANPIRSLEDAKKAVDGIGAQAKRGRPACLADNVLIDVSADNGMLNAILRQELNSGSRRFTVREQVAGVQDIASFLQSVEAFYRSQHDDSKADCVFDYTISWRTDEDYRAARELFERYFYPARIRQLK